MTTPQHTPAPSARPVAQNRVPRLALSVQEACEAIGCSWDFWREHVEPELRVVRRGRRKLIAVTELERWLAENAERALPEANTGIHTPHAPRSPGNSGPTGVRASRAPVGRRPG